MDNVNEAKAKGRIAREDLITKLAPESVADTVIKHVLNIFEKMD